MENFNRVDLLFFFLCCRSEDLLRNFQTMKDLGNHTRVVPSQRVKELDQFVGKINSNKKLSTVSDFGPLVPCFIPLFRFNIFIN